MMETNPRSVIINVDDLGLDWGAGQALLELSRYGSVKSGSVMVPCPWFRQICDLAQNNRELNIGVHLTLTSEWQHYRWRPLTTTRRSSGLIDEDGYFWRSRYLVRENVNREAAEIEFRAQIETAIRAGLDVTHLDCHMGVGVIPELVEIYVRMGDDYRLPVLLPRHAQEVLKLYRIEDKWLPFYKTLIQGLEKRSYPLVDHFLITPCFESNAALNGYMTLLAGLDSGITFLSIHANKPGAILQVDPLKYQVRIDESVIFGSHFGPDWAAEHGIIVQSYKELRDRLREQRQHSREAGP